MDASKNQDNTQQVPKPDEGNKGSKMVGDIKSAFMPHKAHPGPAIPKDFNVAEEGTKEERRAKAQELNK